MARTISNTLLMTRIGSVMRRTTRNQSIGRWSVCTNKLTKTAMTNNDQKMRHPLDSKNTFVLFQKLPMVLSVWITINRTLKGNEFRPFFTFLKPITLSLPFLSYYYFPDFQYIVKIFQPSEGPPEGSRIYPFGLLLKNANWLITNRLALIFCMFPVDSGGVCVDRTTPNPN